MSRKQHPCRSAALEQNPCCCVFLHAVLALEFIVYMIIAIYFDNVFANENGVRKKPWYFLSPSYWGYLRNRHTLQSPVECPQKELEQDSDVAVESMAMQQVLLRRTNPAGSLGITKHPVANGAEGEREVAPGVEDAEAFDEDFLKGNAVEVFGLQKKFGSVGIFRRLWRKMSRRKQTSLAAADGESNNAAAARKKKTSSKSKKRPAEFWAIKGSWFRIQKGKLFCLLGPNGEQEGACGPGSIDLYWLMVHLYLSPHGICCYAVERSQIVCTHCSCCLRGLYFLIQK